MADEKAKFKTSLIIYGVFLIILILVSAFVDDDDDGDNFEETVNETICPLYQGDICPLNISGSPQNLAYHWMVNNSLTNEGNWLELYSLSVIYYAFAGDKWSHADGWLETGSVCLWVGVDCAGLGLDLDLKNNNLIGTIPMEIGLIPNLVNLRLDYNSIYGTIPRTLSLLNNTLRTFYIGYNNIEGTIPSDLFQLVNLNEIYVADNRLSGPFDTSYFYNLTQLTRIVLNNNEFTGVFFTPMIAVMPYLNYLQMKNNSFTGAITQDISDYIPNLHVLDIGYNAFNDCIPKSLFEIETLELVRAQVNKFSCQLFPEIYSAPKLTRLEINSNEFYGPLPYSSQASAIEVFRLSQNKFDDTIPTEFGSNLNRIKEIRMHQNSVTGDMPSELCEIQEQNGAMILSDCGGDDPKVNCACCKNCPVKTEVSV